MKGPIGFAVLAVASTACSAVAATEQAQTWNLPTLSAVPIAWSTCPVELVGDDAAALGERLRCGRMTVPRDHRHPPAGRMEVAIVRVTASDPARRRGALFFNPGGPGGNPMKVVPTLARYWADAYADHPVHGTKKELSEVFDLIGVVPRGLAGGTTFACTSEGVVTDYNDIIADQSEANVRAMDLYMQATAAACRRNPLYRFINTEQTVYDMEVARLSLGEPQLNYYGVSYGTWLGSWYAASFPEHVGRMFLDSNMDWTSDLNTNVERLKSSSHEQFERDVAEPAANNRARYGLGADVAAVVAQLDLLSIHVREGWRGVWKKPESLLAARAMTDMFRAEPDMTLKTLFDRIKTYRFHPDPAVNHAARIEAAEHAWIVMPYTHSPAPFQLDSRDSVFSAVLCNDQTYLGNAEHHKAKIASLASSYPSASGLGLQYHCAYWDGAHAVRPPLSRMAAAGGILMVQAEHDPVTPLHSALAAYDVTPTARLIVADGLAAHAVFGFTDSVCIESAVGTYLLTGALPAARMSRCAAQPVAHGGLGFEHPAQAAALRARLSVLHSPFGS